MGLFIALAKLIFLTVSLWKSFKALKVPKSRRKIPRPVLRRNGDSGTFPNQTTSIQTPPSKDPLSASQRARRTKIKDMLKVCLVWVIWCYVKYLLDWVAWAIPFYDTLQFLFLLWFIALGPAAADTVMKYCVKKVVEPYEKSFDSILGTSHSVLAVLVYLLTSGPRYLNIRWQQWQAKQFNKSLLLKRQKAPPTKLPSITSHHSQIRFPAKSSDTVSETIKSSMTQVSSGGAAQAYVSSTSTTQKVLPRKRPPNPEDTFQSDYPANRKPSLSRKLSAGFKRSVSQTSEKNYIQLRRSSLTRAPSFENPSNRHRLATSHLNALLEPKPVRFSKTSVTLPPIYQSPDVKVMFKNFDGQEQDQEDGDENNSIIIHSDRSFSYPEINYETFSSDQPPQTLLRKRSRTRDEDHRVPERKFKRLNSDFEQKRTKLNESFSQLTPEPSSRSPGIDITSNSTKSMQDSRNIPLSGTEEQPQPLDTPIPGPQTIPDRKTQLSVLNNAKNLKDRFELRHIKSSPLPCMRLSKELDCPEFDETLPPPKRKLHDPDEPLPALKNHNLKGDTNRIRDQALESVRSLEPDWEMPKFNHLNRKYSSLNSSSAFSKKSKAASSKPLTSTAISNKKVISKNLLPGKRSSSMTRSTTNKKKPSVDHVDFPYRVLSVGSKRKEISGKLGIEKAARAAAERKQFGDIADGQIECKPNILNNIT